jgi:hypothetical protein
MARDPKLSPEALDLLVWSHIADLRDLAEETTLMCMRSVPEPSLDDVELSELSTDAEERQGQLVLMWSIERTLRQRCQESLRQTLTLLAG